MFVESCRLPEKSLDFYLERPLEKNTSRDAEILLWLWCGLEEGKTVVPGRRAS